MRLLILLLIVAPVRSFVPLPSRCISIDRAGSAPVVVMGGAKDGPFSPIVKLTSRIVGKERFLPFRARVIQEHTKVIQAFVETSDSPLGCIALKKLFELADVDQSGAVDREELKAALLKLGFSHLSEKQVRPHALGVAAVS